MKHKDFCDGCKELIKLDTPGQHSKCNKHNIVMLPCSDVSLTTGGKFEFIRPDKCKENGTRHI